MKLKTVLTLSMLVFTAQAWGQYPDRPVKIIVPFAAGGVADILARLVSQKVSEQSGRSMIVENRTGAGGRIGYEAGAKSPGDGYTLVATDVTYTMMPALYSGLPWEHADLVPVTLVAQMPFVVAVNANAKATSLADILVLAKADPKKINYGSAGFGSVNHVVTELLKRSAGIEKPSAMRREISALIIESFVFMVILSG